MEAKEAYIEWLKWQLEKVGKMYLVAVGALKSEEVFDKDVEVICDGNVTAITTAIWETLCSDERLMKRIKARIAE